MKPMQQSNISRIYNYSLLGKGKMQILAELTYLTTIQSTEKKENSHKPAGIARGAFSLPNPS